jgi:hypothetical protein
VPPLEVPVAQVETDRRVAERRQVGQGLAEDLVLTEQRDTPSRISKEVRRVLQLVIVGDDATSVTVVVRSRWAWYGVTTCDRCDAP